MSEFRNGNSDRTDFLSDHLNSGTTPPPPPPPPPPLKAACKKEQPMPAARNMRSRLALILIAVFIILVAVGGKVVADRQQEKAAQDLTLGDTIIGSWILYMDNSGIGAYVHLNADGSLQLTEGRLGEWMTNRHRLVEEGGTNFLEFYCDDTDRWVRFMEIKSDGKKELSLIYMQ